MAKTRVHELAKTYGIESKEVLEKLKEMGEFVKSPSSTIELPVEMKFKKQYGDALLAAKATEKPADKPAEKPRRRSRPPRPRPRRPAPAAPAEPRRTGRRGRLREAPLPRRAQARPAHDHARGARAALLPRRLLPTSTPATRP